MRKIYLMMLIALGTTVSYAQQSVPTSSRISSTSDRQFDSWAVSLYGGTSLIQTGDLTSIENGVGDWNFGWDVELGVTKSLTHAFSISLNGNYGHTEQQYAKYFQGYTDYYGISVLADVNMTSLLRRVDTKNPYKWAIHMFGGPGVLRYKSFRNLERGNLNQEYLIVDQKGNIGSFFWKLGGELKYKLNNKFDINFRATYYLTGDEEFDGSGPSDFAYMNPNGPNSNFEYNLENVEEGKDDGFMTFALGVTYKIGKHDEHVMWHDPLKALYEKVATMPTNFAVCNKGDKDSDGVCDDWDKCLNTPKDARIDGSGCPLDTDLDGIYDYEDNCVVVPGVKALKGCPEKVEETKIIPTETNEALVSSLQFKGIEFDLNKADIRPDAQPFLDNAARVMKLLGNKKWIVEGHTDSRATPQYNQELSQRRVESVVNYLVSKGVDKSLLTPIGKGDKELKHAECKPASKCPEWKNFENRRVIFKINN